MQAQWVIWVWKQRSWLKSVWKEEETLKGSVREIGLERVERRVRGRKRERERERERERGCSNRWMFGEQQIWVDKGTQNLHLVIYHHFMQY